MATLSGGQKSRVAFAILSMQQPRTFIAHQHTTAADMRNADLLIIDEPTNQCVDSLLLPSTKLDIGAFTVWTSKHMTH